MKDNEVFALTIERLNLTNKAAAAILGVSEQTIGNYLAERRTISSNTWRVLHEWEAKIYQRRQTIRDQAAKTSELINSKPSPPRRRGRPRKYDTGDMN